MRRKLFWLYSRRCRTAYAGYEIAVLIAGCFFCTECEIVMLPVWMILREEEKRVYVDYANE